MGEQAHTYGSNDEAPGGEVKRFNDTLEYRRHSMYADNSMPSSTSILGGAGTAGDKLIIPLRELHLTTHFTAGTPGFRDTNASNALTTFRFFWRDVMYEVEAFSVAQVQQWVRTISALSPSQPQPHMHHAIPPSSRDSLSSVRWLDQDSAKTRGFYYPMASVHTIRLQGLNTPIVLGDNHMLGFQCLLNKRLFGVQRVMCVNIGMCMCVWICKVRKCAVCGTSCVCVCVYLRACMCNSLDHGSAAQTGGMLVHDVITTINDSTIDLNGNVASSDGIIHKTQSSYSLRLWRIRSNAEGREVCVSIDAETRGMHVQQVDEGGAIVIVEATGGAAACGMQRGDILIGVHHIPLPAGVLQHSVRDGVCAWRLTARLMCCGMHQTPRWNTCSG